MKSTSPSLAPLRSVIYHVSVFVIAGLLSSLSVAPVWGGAMAVMEYKAGIAFDNVPSNVTITFDNGVVTNVPQGFGNHSENGGGTAIGINLQYKQEFFAKAYASADPTSGSKDTAKGPTGNIGKIVNETNQLTTINYTAFLSGFGTASVSRPEESAGYRFNFTLSGQSDVKDEFGEIVYGPFKILTMSDTVFVPNVDGYVESTSYTKELTFNYTLSAFEEVTLYIGQSEIESLAYSPASVPEPSSLGLCLAAAGILALRRYGGSNWLKFNRGRLN